MAEWIIEIQDGFPNLKKMTPLVRCKDCVHHKNAPKTADVWCDRLDGLLPKDWFCADGDGERREND